MQLLPPQRVPSPPAEQMPVDIVSSLFDDEEARKPPPPAISTARRSSGFATPGSSRCGYD